MVEELQKLFLQRAHTHGQEIQDFRRTFSLYSMLYRLLPLSLSLSSSDDDNDS